MLMLIHPAILLPWVILSLLIGWLGRHRKFRFTGHFLASLLFTPLIGLIILLATSPRPRTPTK